jgi:hypothetical protein
MIDTLRGVTLWALLQCVVWAQAFGQITPQWVFASDMPEQQAYHLMYTVGQQQGAWDFSLSELEQVTSVSPGAAPEVLELKTDGGTYGLAKNWVLNFAGDTLQSVVSGAGQAWVKLPGTAGLVYDSTAFYPVLSSTMVMDTLLSLMPQLSQTSARYRKTLVSRDGTGQWAYLLNTKGWPVVQVRLQDEALKEWLTFEYQWEDNGSWSHIVVHNRLSGHRQLLERRRVAEGEPASGWMAVNGGAGYRLLAENGVALYWDGRSTNPTEGTWNRKGAMLTIQMADQREALSAKVAELPWGWEAEVANGGKADWVWLTALQMESRRLQRWREAAETAHLEEFTEKARVGLRNPEGQEVLSAGYDEVEPVHPHFTIVKLEERLGVVGAGGITLLPIYFEKLEYLGDSLLLAQRLGKQGILHLSGDTVVAFAYERLIPRNDTSYWAFSSGKMGLINASGTTLIEPRFDLIEPFHDDQAVAVVKEQTGVINDLGDWVIAPGQFTSLTAVGIEGYLVQTGDNLWGFTNRQGRVVIEPEYGHLRALAPGMLIAQQEGQFGMLSTSGHILAPVRYRMLKGCGDYTATDAFCRTLSAYNVVGQFVSDDAFGYLDALGRAHPPVLPTAREIEATYQEKEAGHGLVFTFPKGWRLEESIQKLYKQGDYGQSRVVYKFLPAEGQALSDWVAGQVAERLEKTELGGQPALTYTERERVRYYDFFKKHLYSLSPDGQTIIHLEFSCKEANFLESIPHLYEIQQLVRFAEE